MTTIIQIMNSNGVAFATDSAVSFGPYSNNSAQKLFSLPGRQPVAFMIMGSGVFAPTGLSWDRIFYMYNLHYIKKHGENKELNKIDNYEKDFIQFLESLVSAEDNERALGYDLFNYFTKGDGSLKYISIPNLSPLDNATATDDNIGPILIGYDAHSDQINKLERILEEIQTVVKLGDLTVEQRFRIEQVEKNHSETVSSVAESIVIDFISVDNFDSIPEHLQDEMSICSKKLQPILTRHLAFRGNNHSWKSSRASVILGGFSKKEKHPRTTMIATGSRVNGVGGSDLVVERNIIDPSFPLSPEPDPEWEEGGTPIWRGKVFMQSDAEKDFVARLTEGLDPFFTNQRNISNRAGFEVIRWLRDYAADLTELEGIDDQLAESIVSRFADAGIDRGIAQRHWNWVSRNANNLKTEFRGAVLRLSPLDLAELASNLIEIQAKMNDLLRVQASVDLPVDVCYLSKENGFVWYARKNIPDRAINPNIFSIKRDGAPFN